MSNLVDEKEGLPRAEYLGSMVLAGSKLECAVLNDKENTRVFSQSSVFSAFQRKGGGIEQKRKDDFLTELSKVHPHHKLTDAPNFFNSKTLIPYMNEAFLEALVPIKYLDGKQEKTGYKVTLLKELCDLYLRARRDQKLPALMDHLAIKAEILLSAFASIGLVALVDEATGYQSQRNSDALRVLVNQYIIEEARKWTKEFNDSFFTALDTLYGNERTTAKTRPSYCGKFINKYIYAPIENGLILSELKKKQHETGTKKGKLHQYLTEEHGLKVLQDRISRVTVLLQIADGDKDVFVSLIEKADSSRAWLNFGNKK